jgi:hypothetical protein
MAEARYPIRIGRRSRWLLLAWGVTASRAEVIIAGGLLTARVGFFTFRTPVANITRWRIEGPFRWITAIGVRRAIRTADVTFGGSAHGGVRLDFHDRVRWTVFRVPALYVTVDDLEGMAADLARLGIPGEDLRRDGVARGS